MPQVYSKIIPPTSTISTTCVEYVHPWTDSCLQAICGLYLYSILDSLRIYGTVYVLTLIMKGRIPTKDDLKRTLFGILQSTAFLSGEAFGYSLFLCSLRRLLGHFNILTISFIPSFLSSVFAILIERPSRRVLLALYVSNVATETVWKMLERRNWVKSVNHGEVALFSGGIALLLWFYKGGYHKKSSTDDRQDQMFSIFRFILGPYEEKGYVRSGQVNNCYRQTSITNRSSPPPVSRTSSSSSSRNSVSKIATQALRAYYKIIQRIKGCDRHNACPHPYSCLYYSVQGTGRMFSIGIGIQFVLKLLFNLNRIIQNPSYTKALLLRKDNLKLALFLGGFSGLFRGSMCILRRITGKDSPSLAIPAGLLAGVAFSNYPDNTIALYVVWKAAQVLYSHGISQGYVPRVPGFTEFLYCFSTAILFHAALLEPSTLRPNYWKFLHSISGGRIACMDRKPLDAWGLKTSEALEQVLKETKTIRKVYF